MHGNIQDIKGNRYGNLTVLELTELRLEHKRGAVWKCRCDCGNICYKTAADLKDSRRKTCSCGCQTKRRRNFPNKFVKKEAVTRVDRAREELASLILERFKDTPYIDELKEGISKILTDIDVKKEESAMNRPINMIMVGKTTSRKVIICGSDYCYLLFREKDGNVSDWAEAFSVEDGKNLLGSFTLLDSSAFGRMLNKMIRENQDEGGGTTTELTLEKVTALLKEHEMGLEVYAEQIYKALKSNKRAVVELK